MPALILTLGIISPRALVPTACRHHLYNATRVDSRIHPRLTVTLPPIHAQPVTIALTILDPPRLSR